MSQLLLAPRAGRARTSFADQQSDSPVPGGPRLTLDERMSRVWEGLRATGTADCPVCRGHMERSGHGGRCLSCKTVVS
jgi:hypothetical protein